MTTSAVGLAGAQAVVQACRPDVVICDYDLLATGEIAAWEQDPWLSRIPVLAVSMTRRPDEENVLDVNGIGGFLYLPAMRADELRCALAGVHRRPVAIPADFALHAAAEWTRATSGVR